MAKLVELITPTWIPETEGEYIPVFDERIDGKRIELVRCKDCKHCDLPEEKPYENGYCSRCGYVTMNWFCADGEPRSTNAPSDTDTTYPVPQSDIATIMNRINEGLDGTGYIAEGYENTDTFLHVLVNREVCGQ